MLTTRLPPPVDEQELLQRAQAIAGLSLGAVAEQHQQTVPADQTRAKGWAGQLIETALGAHNSSRPGPDFPELGIELKTLPVSRNGQPRETTYICTAPVNGGEGMQWETSNVYHKLKRILWVPLEAEPDVPLAQRHIGTALLWSPEPEQAVALRADWEELMEMISLGQVENITAHLGACLQIRPKAADSRARRKATGENGEPIDTLPRGFYLRTSFTAEILRRYFILPQ